MTNKREPFAKVFEYGINVGEIERVIRRAMKKAGAFKGERKP